MPSPYTTLVDGWVSPHGCESTILNNLMGYQENTCHRHKTWRPKSLAPGPPQMNRKLHVDYESCWLTTSPAVASAECSLPTSLLPPWAESGRPPPLPPRRSPTSRRSCPRGGRASPVVVVYRHDEPRLSSWPWSPARSRPNRGGCGPRRPARGAPGRPALKRPRATSGTPRTSLGEAARRTASSRAWSRWARGS